MLIRISLVAAIGLSLAGCGVFRSGDVRASSDVQVDMTDYFVERLETGRGLLKAGHLTKAIDAYRQASYDPRIAAEATNGMAVAYTRLGREDVARQLFLKAIAAAPEDERFSRNLARLEANAWMRENKGPQFAEAPQEPVQLSRTDEPRTEQPPVSTDRSVGDLIPSSTKEFRIITRSPVDAEAEGGTGTISPAPAPARPAKVIITAQRSERPMRAKLVNSSGSLQSGQQDRAYPIRIALKP